MGNVKPVYRGTMSELYAISTLAVNNLEEDLADFTAKKTIYDADFVTAMRALIKSAKDLPDADQRAEVHGNLEGLLPALKNTCVDNFDALQSYIRSGWPGADPKPRYVSAGLENQKKIGGNNWEECVKMNEKMVAFLGVTENADAMTDPGGMPGTFAAKVAADADAFSAVYGPFLAARETTAARNAKITANNLLYNTFIGGFMMDGVELVFKRDEGKKKRYVFNALKDLVSPPGSASLKVLVKRADDTFVENALVKIKKEGDAEISGNTDVNGVVVFKSANPGVYAGSVNVGGVVTNFTKDVDTGVDARVTVVVA